MTNNRNIYVLIACILYLVVYLCMVTITTRHNRTHQYRNDDDIEVGKKEMRGESENEL